jgi:hypothetical protein
MTQSRYLTHFTVSTKRKKRYGPSEEEMELNKEKKMKSEQAVLPNPCLEEQENFPVSRIKTSDPFRNRINF